MRTRQCGLMFTMVLAACGTDPSSTGDPVVLLPPGGGTHGVNHLPGGAQGVLHFGGNGSTSFTFAGATAPGTETFVDAPIYDRSSGGGPSAPEGTGTMNLTINGTAYASSALSTVTLVFPDDNNVEYLALEGYMTYAGPGGAELANEIAVIVRKSDFALNTPIALDGQDRIALFATGDANAENPTLVAAAITGTVTFTAGSLAPGATVSANVSGDFGEIDFVPPPGSSSSLTAGSYTLAVFGPADVSCDGTLAGHESDFAGITLANLGLVGGTVAITLPAPDAVQIDGAPISAGFGAAPLALDPADDGLVAGFSTTNTPGPAGTERLGNYIVLASGTATPQFVDGGVGAGYATPDRAGTCTVAFGASLTAP